MAENVKAQQAEIKAFLNTCLELGITKEESNRKKFLQLPYEETQ